MRAPRPPRSALLLAAVLLLPMLPTAPSEAPVASLTPAVPQLGGFEAVRALLQRYTPAGMLEHAYDHLPWPLGPTDTERLLAELDARPGLGAGGPSLAVSGDVPLTEDWVVFGDLALTNADVRFLRSGLAVRVHGTLTVADSTFRTDGLAPLARGTVEARAGLDVQRSTFAGVGLVARNTSAPGLVTESTFRDLAGAGLVADRPALEVRQSTFVNLTTGIDVTDAHGFPELGPEVHNSTFEMTRAGISVGGDSAGDYHHNLGRANWLAVSCTSPGAEDQQGNEHRPRFFENNLHTNYGEAVSGLRGITITTPVGEVSVPSSACDHDRPYLGPGGAARDSTFLSTDDTLTNVQASPNPTSAPALPLPLTEVTTTETWTGERVLSGPVVVNSPGDLTLDDATVRGPYFLGAKANGHLEALHSTLDPLASLLLRNAADLAEDLDLGGPQNLAPVTMYRCNCSLRDSRVTYAGIAVIAMGGLLTDDTAWRPAIDGNTLDGRGLGVLVLVVRPQVTGNTFLAPAIALLDTLGTTNFQDNVVERASIAITAVLDTLTSSGNRYEAGLVGVVALLATTTFASDLIASYQIAMLPVVPTTFSVTSSNLTFNGVGVIPILGVAALATTNLVDNYFFALLTLPIDTGDLDIPTGITCTTCWGPSDEARWGNVTYVSALSPNSAPQPPWEGSQRIARSGETKDLGGTLAAPAVARSGGTLRIRETTVDLDARFPLGAKGGGVSGGTTGKLVVENSTVRNGAFLALNSTSSTITYSRFEDFPDGAVTMVWNGGTFACNAVRDMGSGFRFNIQGPSAAPAVVRQLLAERTAGLTTGLIGAVKVDQSGRVEDSGITQPDGGGLFHRAAPGEAHLHRSNLLGPEGAVGALDTAENLTGLSVPAFDATDNWWDHPDGPGQGGTRFEAGPVGPILEPHAAQAFAPALCQAWDVATPQPRDDGPVVFHDRTIDPSALGISDRAWDFGDGGPVAHPAGEDVQHTFPDGGAYTVQLTDTSASGATATLARSVAVAHTPPKPAFDADVVDEVTPVVFHDRSTHGNPNDAPPAGWTYRWSFGDGQTTTEREPQHRYADGGTYSAKLNTTDNDGLDGEATRTLVVPHVAPVASFDVSGSLETEAYQLVDTSTHPNAPTDGIVNRTWSCSDGFTAFGPSPTHKFPDGGAYTCTLTVRDDDGLSASAQRTIAVGHAAPVAAFGSAGNLETDTFAFTDQSTHPNPADAPPAGWSWAWDFGDGSASAERSPAHRFAEGGIYAVKLAVTDNDGLQGTVSRDVEVAHAAPLAAFSFSPAAPEPGASVAFTDGSTHPNAPYDGLAAWHWDFDDGTTSSAQHPSHAFESLGNYDVTLTVTDDDGLEGAFTLRVPVGNLPPVAAWTFAPEAPTDLDTVQFTDASTDPDGTIVAWAWDFDDGATSAAQHPTHLFADDGLYTVALRVTDDRGASATLARVLEVANVPPTANFNFGPDDPVAGQEVQFADTSVDPDGTISAWHWDFGDGATSAAQNPTHAWAGGGDYTVTLTVTDDDGEVATVQQGVHVCETRLDLATLTLELCLRLPL